MKESKIAVIGAGYWGKNLIRNFHELGALKAICDIDEKALSTFKEIYNDIKTYSDVDDVLADKEIQGVVIATPAILHYSIARNALIAGKHVFVEKPMALFTSTGRDLVTFAKKQNLILMVGHLLQYHPVFTFLKREVRSGKLGKINYIYSNRLNFGKIRREENILWSFAPHDISMILSLTKEEPEEVITVGCNHLHNEIADVTTTHMTFLSGIEAHIFVSWLHPIKEQKLVVVGDKKMAVFDDTQLWNDKLVFYPHKVSWKDNIPTANKADGEKYLIKEEEPLKIECKQFLISMRTHRNPITNGEEGLRVLKVLNASQKSMDNNSIAVQINNNKKEG